MGILCPLEKTVSWAGFDASPHLFTGKCTMEAKLFWKGQLEVTRLRRLPCSGQRIPMRQPLYLALYGGDI